MTRLHLFSTAHKAYIFAHTLPAVRRTSQHRKQKMCFPPSASSIHHGRTGRLKMPYVDPHQLEFVGDRRCKRDSTNFVLIQCKFSASLASLQPSFSTAPALNPPWSSTSARSFLMAPHPDPARAC